MSVRPIPQGFHTITPQIVVKGVAAAIEWYSKALGAHELLRNTAPDGASIRQPTDLGPRYGEGLLDMFDVSGV